MQKIKHYFLLYLAILNIFGGVFNKTGKALLI